MSEDDPADDDWFESAFEDDESETSGTDASDAGGGESEDADDPFGDDSPFESDVDGTEDQDASPFGDTGVEEADPFGDTGGGGSAEGGGAGDEGPLFKDDFAEAMGGASGGSDFEDDEIDTEIPRLDLGIEGLDNMIQGGVPVRHLVVTIGGAGTGKTTFGLQFLNHGLEKEDTEKGVFITLEQTHDDIVATAAEHGWEFERHEAENNLAIVDLDPVEMANSLDNIRGELPALIEEFDADRFVLDSVSLLEMMYDDQARRRTEVFDFTQSLKQAGVTTVLISEADENNPYASRHGVIEYLTDAVFLLRYVRNETQETRLAVEIQKIRNANHSRETKPYEITLGGISVYEQANIF